MSFKVGLSKKEMSLLFKDVGMMGYGQIHNTVHEAATPLFSRAVVIQDEKNKFFIFVNLEIAFTTIAIKESVTSQLIKKFPEWNLSLENILITAQHTHSAPGGYSHYPFYNFTINGFRPQILKAIVNATVEAVTEASQNLFAAEIRLGHHQVPTDIDVAFNRSMTAYLNNPDVEKLSLHEWHLAVDRRMQVLEIYDQNNTLRGHLNWFGVHCTSISSFNHRIHHDNKGVAALSFEKAKNCFALFAQSAAGDVSPNYVWDKKLKRMRGRFEDQYESAAYNGELQSTEAQKVKTDKKVEGQIEAVHAYHNMALHAAPPAHGIPFFQGTLEGPGIPHAVGNLLSLIPRLIKFYKLLFHYSKNRSFYEQQGKKHILLDHRTGLFVGLPLKVWKLIPSPAPEAAYFSECAKKNALETLPWVPSVIPLQIIKLGNISFVAVPGEITTIAARRLKAALAEKLSGTEIIVSSYANGFMGYITTPEEYDMQCYEGGHTIYGRNTLPVLIEAYLDLLDPKSDLNCRKLKSFQFPEAELKLRTIE